MRCAACGHENEPESTHCASCGVELDVRLHEELSKLAFLLDELRLWQREGRISSKLRSRLSERYLARKRNILGTLRSRSLEAVEEEKEPEKAPEERVPEWLAGRREKKDILKEEIKAEPEEKPLDWLILRHLSKKAPEKKPAYAPVVEKKVSPEKPEPVAPAAGRDFKYYARRLFSDRNIRILQQVGIFVFIAGVIAFVTSQWETWPKYGKMLSMLLLTVGFFVGGSVLRKKTQMRWTAISVTMLGTLFIPITCYVGTRHQIFTGEPAAYWIVACLISVGINGFLAKVLSEEIFAYFAWAAVYGLVGSVAKTLGASYHGLMPYMAAASVVLLMLRPGVESCQKKVNDLDVSFARPLEILLNIAAGALFVLLFIFLVADSYSIREHFARHFGTVVFLTLFCVNAARATGRSFYLYAGCVLKITGYGVWVYAFEVGREVAIPLLMTLGVSFYIMELFLKARRNERFALPYIVFGKMIRTVVLIAAAGMFLGSGITEGLDTLLFTLGQFAGLCIGVTLYTRAREDAAWMLTSSAAWLFCFLWYMEVGWHNFPVYFLIFAGAACFLNWLVRGTRFAPLSKEFAVFTHALGAAATAGIAVAFYYYVQEAEGHGLVNLAAGVLFAFYAGTATRRPEWLTAMFVALAGLLTLALHAAGVGYYYYPACLGALASGAVLLTAGGIVWELKEDPAVQSFTGFRPNWKALRRLLSLPGLAGSLLVAGIAFILLLVSYAQHFDNEIMECQTWRECLLGITALAAYCVAGALSSKREQFEHAALVLATAGYLLFLQSCHVTLGTFAWAAAMFCLLVIFVGLLFSFLKKKFMSRSALNYGLLLTVAASLAMLLNPQSYQKESLLSPALVLTVASAAYCYFSLRRQKVIEASPEFFTYIWSASAVAAYAFFFMWTDTQFLRDLYTVPAAGALLTAAAYLKRRHFDMQYTPLIRVSYLACVVPFLFMLGQLGSAGRLSPDNHLTLIVALCAIGAYHVAAASVMKARWPEYAAISLSYMAFVTFLLKNHVQMPRFGLLALSAVFAVFLVGMVFTRLKRQLFTRSAFICGLVLLGVSVVIPLCHRDSYADENLPFIFATLLLAAGVMCYFALRRLALFARQAEPFSYAFGILLCVGYSFFFLWTDVQFLRDLYTVPAAAGLLALSVLLKRKQFHPQRQPMAIISYAASVAPFLFMLVQVDMYGQLSPDTHLTLITALSAVCAYHVAAAAVWKKEWLEYAAISTGYLAYVVLLLKYGIGMPKFGMLALPAVFAIFLVGQIFSRLRKQLFTRSAFLAGLALLAVSVVIPMCHPDSYEEQNLPFVFGTLLIAAGVMCYFALRRLLLFEKASTPFSYSFAVLLCVGHALFLEWLSTGTPLAGLYFLQVSVLLLVAGWILERFKFERQWRAPCFISFAATGVAMYLAISRSDLTAMLVFIACCVLYGFLQIIMRYRFFLWAATISFSAAYFFALRHADVEPVQYLLWFSILSAAKVAFSVALARVKEVPTTPAFVVGMLISFSAMVVMLALSERYFIEHIDMAIASTLIAAGTYFLSARRTRYIFFYYLSCVTALGAYYLLLHKYEITMTEFFTLPVAGLMFAAATIHLRQGIKNKTANWGYVLAVSVLLLPSLIRSMWISHLDSCLIAYALGFGCLLAAMMFKRKVLFGAAIIAIATETVIKLVHFIMQRHLSKAEIIMIVGLSIFIFAVSLELIRNRRLREKAGLTRKKMKDLFADWS